MKLIGGPESVASDLRGMGLVGVGVGAYERDLQSLTAGLTWRIDYGIGWNFQTARALLPTAVREAALADYLEDPIDGAAPEAITSALVRLATGDLLSPRSTGYLLDLMQAARTGPRRLKGGLQPGWRIAHKTGTGQDFRGASVGINDVGLLTAPDGRVYAVAVMIRRTHQPVPRRLELMQAVTRAVANGWAVGPTAD
jgi:beta-lactamase class A